MRVFCVVAAFPPGHSSLKDISWVSFLLESRIFKTEMINKMDLHCPRHRAMILCDRLPTGAMVLR